MIMDDRTELRSHILRSLGAGGAEIKELLLYNQNLFDRSGLSGMAFPLPDEAFVRVWEGYAKETEAAGSILPLRKHLVQLNFPVREGMSGDPGYVAATLSGEEPGTSPGLGLRAPERCRLFLHPTLAGRIPILIAGVREDFQLLVQALSKRNEPAHIPESMGACMIAGYRNWHRIRLLVKVAPGAKISERLPDPAVQARLQDKSSYQDRFIILSSGFYSGVPPERFGLSEQQWREFSLVIRREHECTHYFTRRVFSSMRNHLMDEMIADYSGIVGAQERFRQDWMLAFLGLENFPAYTPGARLENYRGNPPLSPSAFVILQRLVKQAAENLELFDRSTARLFKGGPEKHLYSLAALSGFTMEELASAQAPAQLHAAFADSAKTLSAGRIPQSGFVA